MTTKIPSRPKDAKGQPPKKVEALVKRFQKYLQSMEIFITIVASLLLKKKNL